MVVKHKGYIFSQINDNVYKISNKEAIVSMGACENPLTEDEAKKAIEKYIKKVE